MQELNPLDKPTRLQDFWEFILCTHTLSLRWRKNRTYFNLQLMRLRRYQPPARNISFKKVWSKLLLENSHTIPRHIYFNLIEIGLNTLSKSILSFRLSCCKDTKLFLKHKIKRHLFLKIIQNFFWHLFHYQKTYTPNMSFL